MMSFQLGIWLLGALIGQHFLSIILFNINQVPENFAKCCTIIQSSTTVFDLKTKTSYLYISLILPVLFTCWAPDGYFHTKKIYKSNLKCSRSKKNVLLLKGIHLKYQNWFQFFLWELAEHHTCNQRSKKTLASSVNKKSVI